jgi:hypothetical protein
VSNYPTPETSSDDYFWFDDDEPANDDPGDCPEESER